VVCLVVCLAVCRAAFLFVTRVAAARPDLDVALAGALGLTFLVAIFDTSFGGGTLQGKSDRMLPDLL
jgi:hypothetical protein